MIKIKVFISWLWTLTRCEPIDILKYLLNERINEQIKKKKNPEELSLSHYLGFEVDPCGLLFWIDCRD